MSLASAHWFDFVAVVMLIVGFKVGQRTEALPQLVRLAHWLVTFFICLFLYKAPAIWLANRWNMQPDTVALIIFPIEFLIVFLLLRVVRWRVADKIVSKQPFGNWEPRVTAFAGALRFLVYTLIIMAWVSGRYVTAQDLKDHETFCKENFGGITFPVLATVHHEMFEGSYTGRYGKKYLSAMLLTAIPRVQLKEEPADVATAKTRKVKLRELDDDFDRKPPVTLNKEPQDRPQQEEAEKSGSQMEQVKASETPTQGRSITRTHRALTLKGVSGSGANLFALINDETFRTGDSVAIKFEDRKILLHCVQIQQNSVLVKLDDKSEPFELKMGIATDLNGQAVGKK